MRFWYLSHIPKFVIISVCSYTSGYFVYVSKEDSGETADSPEPSLLDNAISTKISCAAQTRLYFEL